MHKWLSCPNFQRSDSQWKLELVSMKDEKVPTVQLVKIYFWNDLCGWFHEIATNSHLYQTTKYLQLRSSGEYCPLQYVLVIHSCPSTALNVCDCHIGSISHNKKNYSIQKRIRFVTICQYRTSCQTLQFLFFVQLKRHPLSMFVC